MKLLQIFLYGYVILTLSIFINVMMKSNGIMTWYDLLSLKDFSQVSVLNLFVLLVAYPFVLGISVFIVDRILKK
ncbi:MAG: hypothetical protein EBV07_00555 [Proteobacteria bacterium]|nr:hypothetical protein [Pseudomonadota bacterium]